jgi:hypothetical protein
MDEIITERSDSVLRVQLNRPTKRNAMTSRMYATLTDVFNNAAKDEDTRVVLWMAREIRSARAMISRIPILTREIIANGIPGARALASGLRTLLVPEAQALVSVRVGSYASLPYPSNLAE